MSDCTHHWTVTSECPMCLRTEIERLKKLIPPDSERSHGGVGQSTWSVFAEKMMAERDAALARVAELEAALRKIAALRIRDGSAADGGKAIARAALETQP